MSDLFVNEDYLFITKNMNEIERLIVALEEKKIKYNSDNFLLIEDSKNFEDEIASAFDLKNSESRKNDLQNIANGYGRIIMYDVTGYDDSEETDPN